MKEYFKKFWVLYAIIAVLCVVYLIAAGMNGLTATERTNTECLTEERVFDYADLLTDQEEDSLRKLIAKREKQTGCDIVLVVTKEKLEEGYSIMEYADDFYDQNQFGYDEPVGDGVLLVDNWYNDSTYNGEIWFSTCGKAEYAYSDYMIDDLLDYVCQVVNENPYKAYERYVNQVYRDMSGSGFGFEIKAGTIFFIALFVTAVYLFICLSGHKGKKTTTAYTYVENGVPRMNHSDDIFITKRVTSRKIESSSGSRGGGGHHRSSGGHSHGGGGRRH